MMRIVFMLLAVAWFLVWLVAIKSNDALGATISLVLMVFNIKWSCIGEENSYEDNSNTNNRW